MCIANVVAPTCVPHVRQFLRAGRAARQRRVPVRRGDRHQHAAVGRLPVGGRESAVTRRPRGAQTVYVTGQLQQGLPRITCRRPRVGSTTTEPVVQWVVMPAARWRQSPRGWLA